MLGTSIINFPTKKHWRSPSHLQDVIKGLDVFSEKYKEWGIESIAFPPLGCGNGGLEWAVVGPIMYQKLSKLDINVEIYAPYGTPKQLLSGEFLSKEKSFDIYATGKKNTKLNPTWIALLDVLGELEKQPYASPVGRTIFQKICYVMTEQGIDTGFNFTQGSYGPFSSEVKDALSVLANMNLVQEKQLGRMTALTISDGLQEIGKKYQKEQSLSQVSEQDIYDIIIKWKKTWNEPKKQKSIVSAIRNLEMLGWVKLKYSNSLPY